MALQNNPIFQLASAVARGALSKEDALQKSVSPQFLKQLRNKTFDEVIRTTYANFFHAEPEPPPPELTAIGLECAAKWGLKGELRGMLLWAHAADSIQKGDLETSFTYVTEAKRILRTGGFSNSVNLCDMLLLEAAAAQGSDQRVSAFGRSADPNRKELRGLSCGIRQLRSGTFLNALGAYERAIPCFTTAKWQLIRLQRETQRYRFACRKTLQSAQSEFKRYQLLHVPSLITCDLGLAHSFFNLGKYDLSLKHLLSGRRRAIQSGAVGLLGQLEMLYAVTCRQLGDFPTAIKILEESHQVGVSAYPILRFRSQIYLATLYCDLQQFDRAISLLETLRNSVAMDGVADQVAECDRKLAWIYRELGEIDKAIPLLQQAREVFEQRCMDLDVAWCDADLAQLEVQAGRYETALRLLQDLRSRSWIWASPNLFQQLSHYLGHIFWKIGRLEDARREYAQSIETIEQLRHGSAQPELRASYLKAKRLVYSEAIDCCLEQGDFAAALEYVERLKSRSLAEMLQGRSLCPRNSSKEAIEQYGRLTVGMRVASQRLGEREGSSFSDGLLKDYLDAQEDRQDFIHMLRKNDPDFDPDQTVRISYGDIRSLVTDPTTALIEFFPMQDKTVAFIVLPGRDMADSTLIIKDYNHSTLQDDRQAARDKEKVESILERLHYNLFDPMEPYLCGIERLIFIPYSGLHLLPLHAMFTQKNGSRRYLLDDYLVTYAPSAKILRSCLNNPQVDNRRGCVVWANPRRDLPLAQREAQAVAGIRDWKIVSAATRDGMSKAGGASDILHYTGHANGKALILHHSDDHNSEDPYDTGDIFAGLSISQGSLVTLSACDTGTVREDETDEYIGLPGAFLHAGASTVICSLWSVSDTSTTLLMVKMYRLINEGLGKAEALRQAQLWLKNPDNRQDHLDELEKLLPWLRPAAEKALPDATRFGRTRPSPEKLLPEDLSHPYYWAGFICTGAP